MCLYERTTSQFFRFSDSQILKSRSRSRIPFPNPVPRGIYYVSPAPFVPLYAALLHQCRSVLSLVQNDGMSHVEKLKGEAEADEVEPIVGIVVATSRHTTVPRVAAPAATAKDAVRARRWSSRIRLGTAAVISIPVLTPLIDIAAHVVNAQFIR